MAQKALLIVDVQNDFCPGGALAVPDGDKIIPSLNSYLEHFSVNRYPIFASRDWHPPHTKHFKESGGLWPVHCVKDTGGARFLPHLKLPPSSVILSKGVNPDEDGYSAFEGVDKAGKSLLEILNEKHVGELFIGGLATDYCVKSSALDALKYGFKVKLLTDCIRGVNLKSDDSAKAIAEMAKGGVILTDLTDVKINSE